MIILCLWLLLEFSATYAASAQSGSGQGQATGSTAFPRKEQGKVKETNGGSPIIREKTDVVTLSVTVADKRQRLIEGLEPEHFEVFDNNVKQKIEYFTDDDVPLSIGIIFDVSASMEQKLERAREALKAFVETSHDEDDFFLVTFNDHSRLVIEFRDGKLLLRKLSSVEAKGHTALYDAVYLGLEKVQQGRHRKRALLVISDGEDNASRYSLDELGKLIQESDVQIYCIGIAQLPWGLDGLLGDEGRKILAGIAQKTGGIAFFPRPGKELEDAVTRIALELRRQYSIGYIPTHTRRDGKWHKIKVSVRPASGRPRLNVRAKEGYYSTP